MVLNLECVFGELQEEIDKQTPYIVMILKEEIKIKNSE